MATTTNGIISQVNIDKLYDIAAKYDASHNEIETTYAKLSNGKIPESMLPSYVDDVIEGYYLKDSDSNNYSFYKTNSNTGTKITGESGKIYVGLNNNKTYRWSGSQYTEISAQIAYGMGTAAPNGHTHNVTVSGTTGNNSGSAVKAVTGYGSFSGGSGNLISNTTTTDGIKYVEAQGTFKAGTTPPASATFNGTEATSEANSGNAVEAITGVYVSSSTSAAPGNHTHTYEKMTKVKLAANAEASSGTIQYVQSISGTAPSLTGTKTFATGVTQGSGSLTSDTTATNGIKYVEEVALAAGTTPPASATPTHTNTNSGVNSDSVTIASVDANGVLTLATTAAKHTHTHVYAKTTGITLVDGTAPSLSTNTTKYLHHTHTSAKSAGTGTVGIQGGNYSTTTKYLSATPDYSTTASGVNSGTNFNAATAVAASDTALVAPNGHTHAVIATGTITLNAGTAPSMGSATTKYLHHSHTAASLGTASTANAAPHTHTHSYGSTTALTTGANSGSAVDVLTPIK